MPVLFQTSLPERKEDIINTDNDKYGFEGGGAAGFDNAGVDISDCLILLDAAQPSGGAGLEGPLLCWL